MFFQSNRPYDSVTQAGAVRPAPAAAALPHSPAGLHFPARPAPSPPLRREDGGPCVALGYCALPAAGSGVPCPPAPAAQRSVLPPGLSGAR